MTDEWLTTKQMAAELKLHEETVRAMALAGTIPCIRLGRNTIRYEAAEVKKALKNKVKNEQ